MELQLVFGILSNDLETTWLNLIGCPRFREQPFFLVNFVTDEKV
jgi:hypothetical protein